MSVANRPGRRLVVGIVPGLVALATVVAPTPAFALDSSVLHPNRRDFSSPQHFAFEFRFGPYTPDIDSEPALGATKPYESIFGTQQRFQFGGEFDWQAIRIPHFGSIGPGLQFGYTQMTGKSFVHGSGGVRSGDDTTLGIFPGALVGVLRLDVLSTDLRIPLVPYGKAGIGFGVWHVTNAAGTSTYTTASGATEKATGLSLGTNFAAGVALQLDVFDPLTARNFDAVMGVNHTYLYGEYMASTLNGLGQSDVLRVGASTWVFGITFEF
ncbi:MAG: MXAN_2562 family outer membrane beta-barrel protein [Polyangiaceae bacterium]